MRKLFQPLAKTALLALLLGVATAGAWVALRWGVGAVVGSAARTAGAPAYETLRVVDRDRTDVLVKNALDSDVAVAMPARRALDAYVDRWMVEAVAATDYAEGAQSARVRMLKLQRQVGDRRDQLTPSGARWIEQLADHMIRVAERLPLSDRVAVIEGASRLLDTASQTTLQTESVPPGSLDVEAPAPVAEPKAPADDQLWAIPESLRGGVTAEPAPLAPAARPQPIAAQPVRSQAPTWRPGWQPTPPPERNPEPPEPAPLPEHVAESPPAITANDATSDALSDRELIAQLLDVSGQIAAMPQAIGPAARPDETELGARLEAIKVEVRRRGYRALRADHAQLFTSPRPEDRVALAERLAAEGGSDALRLAMELAHDADPTVRLAALRTLAASPHAEIVRQALAIAVRDPDPRVAGIAGELRTRIR